MASPRRNTAQNRIVSTRPPPEARSAQALFKPQVEPDSETPAAAATVARAHDTFRFTRNAAVGTARSRMANSGDVSRRLAVISWPVGGRGTTPPKGRWFSPFRPRYDDNHLNSDRSYRH